MNYLNDLYDGDIAYRESLLFIRDETGKAQAKLLHVADRIIQAEDLTGKSVWKEGRDFTLLGDTVTFNRNILVPSFEKDFPKSDTPVLGSGYRHSEGGWFKYYSNGELQKFQVFFTYKIKKRRIVFRHEKSLNLNNIQRLIEEGKPIKIVVYGDSISAGRDADPRLGVDKYFPLWSEQLKEMLEKKYSSEIALINTAAGGKKSDWGLVNFEENVLKHKPDLLILGFGMNDGTARVVPEDYYKNIQAMVAATSNDTDIILISTMLPNPKAATVEGITFLGYQRDYRNYLKRLVGNRVDVFDMTSIHEDLLKYKKPEDLLENNINHPNDYLARWYAQGLLKLMVG